MSRILLAGASGVVDSAAPQFMPGDTKVSEAVAPRHSNQAIGSATIGHIPENRA